MSADSASRPLVPIGPSLRLLLGVVSSALLACTLEGKVRAEEGWTSFQNGGRVQLSSAVPREWSPERGITWSAAVPGEGQSSPVAWNGQVYVTSVSGAQKETYHLCAFRLADGGKLWQFDTANASPQESTNYVSRAAPTPVADAAGIVAFFEGGNVVALTHDRRVRWERNLVAEFGAIDARHGLGASLEQTERAAFVWVERQTDPYVLAVDKKTGETLWKVGGVGATSWSSPRLLDVGGGKRHLVLSAIGSIVGLDPDTGERLWTFSEISGNSTPTPVPVEVGRFLIGATTGEGGDGGKAAESNGLIEVSEADGRWQAQFVWRAEKATSSFGSPVACGGHAYFVNRTGVLYCLDLETGREVYAQRAGQSLWATPLCLDDALILPGKDGECLVVKCGEAFEAIHTNPCWPAEPAPLEGAAANPFGGPVLYAAAAVDGTLLFRRGDRLICVADATPAPDTADTGR